MVVIRDERDLRVVAEGTRPGPGPGHVMVIGGKPLGQRHRWWNFVSSSRDRIEQAKADWRAGRFASVPGETGLIPLPGR